MRDSNGARLYDLSTNPAHLTFKSGASLGAASALTVAGNLEIDYRFGTVFIPSTSAFTNGHGLWFTYTSQGTEKTIDQVTLLTTAKKSYFLRFEGINAANNDKRFLLDLHSVSLSADGQLGLIGDEFAEGTLTGVAERNETRLRRRRPSAASYIHGDS
jgi:hypothetical protein